MELLFRSMSRTRTSRIVRWALPLGILLSACAGAIWRGPVPIDPERWDIEIDVCGEIEDVPLEWIEGRVINTTEETSPFYDIRYTLTYDDGSTLERLANEIVVPVASGGAAEFSFSIPSSDGKMITSCELIVTDAVENYT